MRIAVLVVAALLLGHAAHADALDSEKSEAVAFGLSGAGTLLGPALVAVAISEGDEATGPLHAEFWPMMAAGGVAMIIGPSLGNWYAGRLDSTGLNLRLGGAVAAGLGAAMAISAFSFDDNHDGQFAVGGLIALAGVGMVATGTVLDLISAPRAAAEHNRHHLAFAPIAGPKQTGLMLAGTF